MHGLTKRKNDGAESILGGGSGFGSSGGEMGNNQQELRWESLFIDNVHGAFAIREEAQIDDKTPARQMVESERLRELHEGLVRLSRRERNILYRRWGLSGPRECQRRVGIRYGISKQRVNQLEHAALAKLRRYMEKRNEENET